MDFQHRQSTGEAMTPPSDKGASYRSRRHCIRILSTRYKTLQTESKDHFKFVYRRISKSLKQSHSLLQALTMIILRRDTIYDSTT